LPGFFIFALKKHSACFLTRRLRLQKIQAGLCRRKP